MRKAVLILCALLPALLIDGMADRAAARFERRCAALAPAWAPREYWQWDSRPIWDDPWRVLRPNFWGSPEPRRVPADIWACKWHPARDRRRHRQW